MKKLMFAFALALPLVMSISLLTIQEPKLVIAQTQNAINPNAFYWQIVTENTDGSPATDLEGYTIECSTVSSGYKNTEGTLYYVEVQGASTSTFLIKDVVAVQGTFYCAMRAFNSKRYDSNWDPSVAWSAYSNEVSFAINEYGIEVFPPKGPGALAVQ